MVETLPLSEGLQLHGPTLLCARATHVDFGRRWQRSDGACGDCVQQLLQRQNPDAKYLIFSKRQQVLAAVKGFVTGLHEQTVCMQPQLGQDLLGCNAAVVFQIVQLSCELRAACDHECDLPLKR